MRLELINGADVAGQQLQSSGVSAAGGELERREQMLTNCVHCVK